MSETSITPSINPNPEPTEPDAKDEPISFEMEIFRAGDYGQKGKWSEQDLDTIAQDYDTAVHEAPLTTDHAQSGPACGWVRGLRRVGDRLLALISGVPQSVAQLIRDGIYKHRSVELHKTFRETGGTRPYLRAVTLLGAAIPQVKGLAPITFSDNADAPVILTDSDIRTTAEHALRTENNRLRIALAFSETRRNGTNKLPAKFENALCDLLAQLPADAVVTFADDATATGKKTMTAVEFMILFWDAVEKAEQGIRTPPEVMKALFGEAAPETQPAASFSENTLGTIDDNANTALHRAAIELMRREPQYDNYAAALIEASRQTK